MGEHKLKGSNTKLEGKYGKAAASLPKGLAKITKIREGIPASDLLDIAALQRMPRKRIHEALAIPQPTGNRLLRTGKRLSPAYSERVLGMQELAQLVQRITDESGSNEDFDAWA